MLTKSLAAISLAGLLVLGGSVTASAEGPSSPPAVTIVATPSVSGIGSAGPTTGAGTGTEASTDSAEMGADASIALIWLGIGAIGIGGIATAAALARRQANQR